MAIPTIEEMKADYENSCSKFIYNGYTFYYHPKGCDCFTCTETRKKPYPEYELFHCVTLNFWDKDLHWYQSMGNIYTKEQAANRCIGMAGGAIKSYRLQVVSTQMRDSK